MCRLGYSWGRRRRSIREWSLHENPVKLFCEECFSSDAVEFLTFYALLPLCVALFDVCSFMCSRNLQLKKIRFMHVKKKKKKNHNCKQPKEQEVGHYITKMQLLGHHYSVMVEHAKTYCKWGMSSLGLSGKPGWEFSPLEIVNRKYCKHFGWLLGSKSLSIGSIYLVCMISFAIGCPCWSGGKAQC